MKVYTVTMLDLVGDPILGIRCTPAIFTDLKSAMSCVRNNDLDLSDNNLYQYAVIEETFLNVIRPAMQLDTRRYWFKFNTALQEFEPCEMLMVPAPISRLTGFGIG